MPYPITESGGKYVVNDKGYDTKAEAEQYQAALYANVPDAKKSAQGNTGAMLALFLPEDAARALYAQVAPTLIEAGVQEPLAPEDYHLTLVLLGEASVIVDSYEPLITAIQALGDEEVARSSLSGQVNGIGRFATSENGETQPIYASFDAVDLPAFRHQLMELANALGLGLEQNHGFIPHITLAYVPVDLPTPDLRLQPIDVKFADLTLAWGDERRELPLDGDAYGVKSVAFDASTQYAGGPGGLFSLPGSNDDDESLIYQPMQIVKQANGIYRWFSISSNNIKDRDDETVGLKALQADVARTKMFGDDSVLYLYHIPYAIGGAPDYRAIVDGFLVESGEFYDQPVAKAVAEYISAHPEGVDGSGWGVSIGFLGVPDASGTYYNSFINERSPLPMSKAANEITQFGVKNKMTISPDQQKVLDTVLGDPALFGIVKTAISAQEQSKSADEKGVVRKAAQATQAAAAQPTVAVPVLKAGKNEATPQEAMGFGKATVHQKDAAAVQAAAAAEGAAAAAADDASDILQAAMASTDAAVAATIAEGRAAAMTTADPGVVQMAKDATPTPAPVTPPAPANTEAPVPAAKAGMSDEDMQGIAKWVNETVAKAVGDAITQMKSEFQGVYGEMNKMQRTFSAETQAKMLNEVPTTVYERLKAFGMTAAAGIPATLTTKSGEVVANPAYVEKGKNLPPAPDDPVGNLMGLLGFTQPA